MEVYTRDQVASLNPDRRADECNPGQVVQTHVPLTIHQAVIIWHPSKLHGNVTVGLASHYHASQTTVVFSFTGSRLWEMSTLRSSRARYTFIYHVSSQFSHFSNILRNYCLYRKRISRQHSQSTMSFGSHSV